MHLVLKRQDTPGRPALCPVCKVRIAKSELRLETHLYGEQSRQFHLSCAKILAAKIINLVETERR